MEEVNVEKMSVSLPTPIFELQDPNLEFKYPLFSGENVELCAKDLTFCDYQPTITHEEHITLQLDHKNGKNSIVTFCKLDRVTLKPGIYINSNVVDFWLLWVTKNEPHNTNNMQAFTFLHQDGRTRCGMF